MTSGCVLAVALAAGTVQGGAPIALEVAPGGEAAAAELRAHLRLLAGIEPPVAAGGAFVVGHRAPDGEAAGPLEARYRVTGGRVYFWGAREPKRMDGDRCVADAYDGTLFAVYEFLDRELGFKWVMPGADGVVVPRPGRLVPSDGTNGLYVPRYDVGRVRSVSVKDTVEFHLPVLSGPKVPIPSVLRYTSDEARALAADVATWYRRNRNYSRDVFRYGHAFTRWHERFHKAHPEYLAADEKGVRDAAWQPSRKMLCVSNPAVVDQIIADWRAERCPKYLNACENDGGGMCRCANCRALDVERPGEDFLAHKTDRYLNFWNRLAAKAKAIRPDVQVVAYIYSFYRHLPRRERIEHPDNMVFGTVPTLSDDYVAFYDGWAKAGLRRFFLRPNFHCSTASLPRGVEKLVYDIFACCRNRGMMGVDFGAYPGRYSTAIETYVAVRLLRDPNLSFETIVDEFCSAYGEAAPAVKAYFARIRARREASAGMARGALARANLLDDSQASFVQMACHTEEALKGDLDLLCEARARGVSDDACRRRLDDLIVRARGYVLVYRFFAADAGGDRGALEVAARELLNWRLVHRDALMDLYTMTMGSRVRGVETKLWLKVPEAFDTRPYEFHAADRRVDFRPPLVDFESGEPWTVEATNAVATFAATDTFRLFGERTGELRYRAIGGPAAVAVRPPRPLAIPVAGFDTLSVWIRGCRWTHGANCQTTNPAPTVEASFRLPDGSSRRIRLQPLRWMDWHWIVRRLRPDERAALAGAAFDGFRLSGFVEREASVACFDNVAFWVDAPQSPRRPFRTSPRRNLTPLPGTDLGLNTGAGRLPFPTREETILPPPPKGTPVSYRYGAGRLGPAFAVHCPDGSTANVFADGGVLEILDRAGRAARPVAAAEMEPPSDDGERTVRWRYEAADGATAVVRWIWRTWGNSLVVDLLAESGTVVTASPGDLGGVEAAQAFTVPYLVTGPDAGKGRDPLRAPVVVFGGGAKPLFRYACADWYRSNASTIDGDKGVSGRTRQLVRYAPKTDGSRVALAERFFVTVSDSFGDVLPSVPNPKSPYMKESGTRLWRAHGTSDRARDAAFWRTLHRYGVRRVVVNDHETQWRDGGESYTCRTTFAPGKGGDAGQYGTTRLMRDALGYVYGPYNNFWDIAPVNADFDPDDVLRGPDGALRESWMRTYTPKPARMVEWSERYVPAIQRKMDFNTAYCDCHTAGVPWGHADYDARVPGAATFAATFYATGEMLLVQKRDWRGPVFSEGASRMPFAGLVDGNYADDRGYDFLTMPWLVDFDLRELHVRECDFGMGSLSMLWRSDRFLEQRHYVPRDADRPDLLDDHIDEFLAATLAFGHTGLLLADFCFDPPRLFGEAYGDAASRRLDYARGLPIAWRSYFMVQAPAARYTQAAPARIAYADGRGGLEPTTAAILSGSVRRRQVAVRYDDGTCVVANGSDAERMCVDFEGVSCDLPPHGYRAWTADRAVWVDASNLGGRRADYCASPDYVYLDGRGGEVVRERARGTGPAVCRREGAGWEVIVLGDGTCAFRIPGARATALDREGRAIGPAETVCRDGWLSVRPVAGAVSYRVDPVETDADARKIW